MKVLVSGAAGFLGRYVVAELLRRGHAVRALVRPSARLDGLGWDGRAEIVRADLCHHPDLVEAFEGADALVHLAAQIRGPDPARTDNTVRATERLLRAMARARTARLVHVSSLAVYDWGAVRGTLTEDSPLESDLTERDGYAAAKLLQEELVRRLSREHGWALTVLRPGFLWGPGGAVVAGIGQRVGPALLVVGPRARLPLTHVANCADCIAAALESSRAVGETFNVVDDDDVRAWRYAGACLRGSGVRAIRIPVPYGPAQALVRLVHGSVGRFRRLPGLLVPGRFEARFKSLRYSDRRLREVLGWRPPRDFAECLRHTYGPGGAGAGPG